MLKNLNTAALGISGRPSEVIELALSFGFKGIDLDLVEFQEQVKAKGLPTARRLLDSAKLKVGSFVLPVVWDEDDEKFKQTSANLNELAKLAAELGCTRCTTAIAPANDLRPYHENFEFHRRRLSELGDLLAPHKIQLGVDIQVDASRRQGRAYQFMHTFDALATLLSMTRATNVGIVFDTWNWQATGGTLEQLKKLGLDRVITVNVADITAGTEGQVDEQTRLLPGETGIIDTPALLVMLAEAGYAGPITPVPHPARFKTMSRDAIVKLTGAQLDLVWKAAGLSPQGKLTPAVKK